MKTVRQPGKKNETKPFAPPTEPEPFFEFLFSRHRKESLDPGDESQSPEQSSNILSWKDVEGHNGTFQPYIVPGLPVNLWGRDVMKEMGVYLYSPSKSVTQQMFDQGLLPDKRLGCRGQGIEKPLMPIQRPQRAGLGYF